MASDRPMNQDSHRRPWLEYPLPHAGAMIVSASTGSHGSTQTESSLSSVGDQSSRATVQSPNHVGATYGHGTWVCPSYNSRDPEPLAAPLSASSRKSTNREHGNVPNTRYLCMVPACESSFSRSADLNRHYNSVHFPQNSMIDCPKHRCSRKGKNGFPRPDHLKEHLRQYHGEGLPKRRPERFKLSN